VEWRVYVVANETTGRLEVPYGYSDTWSNATPAGGDAYTAVWDTTTLNETEALTHRYVVVFRVTDNNTQPNTVYRNITVVVDNDPPSIFDGPCVVSPNNVEEEEGFSKETNGSRTVIYTKETLGGLVFGLSDERLGMYYDIDGNQSRANLEAYLNCLSITVLDEYEGGNQTYSNCEIINGSGGLYLLVRNYTLVTGTHNLTLTVTDLAGNMNQSIRAVDIVVDQVPPVVIPIVPRDGMWLKRVINANPLAELMDLAASGISFILDQIGVGGFNRIQDRWDEGVLFGAYVDDGESPVLTDAIYMQLSNRPGLLFKMEQDFTRFLNQMDECPLDCLLESADTKRDYFGGEFYSMLLACSGYQDLGLTVFEERYGDRVFWCGTDFTPWDFFLNIWSQSWLSPTSFTCRFTAWDKAGNRGTANSTFVIVPYASAATLEFDVTVNSLSYFLETIAGLNAYVEAIESEIASFTSGNKGTGGETQGGSRLSLGEFGGEPVSAESGGLPSGSGTLLSGGCGVCGGEGNGSSNESGWEPGVSLITVEQALNYEFYEDVLFLPWMKLSFRVFGAPRDVSLNIKFGNAPFIRLFFDSLSFQEYGCTENSVLLRASPDTWNIFTIPLYRIAKGLGLFEGLNAPTNISVISVSAYGGREVWECRAVFDGFWVATPVPLVEEYAEKAALARDNYYKILNVSRESNLEVLRKDIFEVFAASYTEDFEYLADCLENFTQHLFPSGEMQEFTGASVQTIYYNTSNSSVPLFVIYSFPEGLENVSLLAAYNYTNIPDVDLSREAVLNASLTELCEQLAQGEGVLSPYGLADEDLAYLPYGAASFVIVNDTVCFDRLSAKPCTIQSVLATIASIAERVWNHRCLAKVVEQEEEYQLVESFRAFVNESMYRVETFKKLLAAVQWVNYMHPFSWDQESFDTLVDPENSPYWLSYTYAGWGNETGYELLAECLVNIIRMLDFGDRFGAPPVFIVSGEYNRTAESEGEDCVLIFKAVERERSLDVLFGARQGSVLFAVFNDTDVLNVARKYGRQVNCSLADVYVYFAEMALMYTRPYNSEEVLSGSVFDIVGQLFSGISSFVDQIANEIGSLIQYFAAVPFVNLVTTLNALFTQKFDRKCRMMGIDNYVEWLVQQEESLSDFNDIYDPGTVHALNPGETLTEQGGAASLSAISGGVEFGSEPLSQEYTVVSNTALSGTSMVCGAPVSNESMLPSGYDATGGAGSGNEQVGSVPPDTSKDARGSHQYALGAYTDIDKLWEAILHDKNTVYLLEYLNPNWRETGTPPEGPIINFMSSEQGKYYGFESSRYLFNFIRSIENTFTPRSTSEDSKGFTRALLNQYIGKHYRDVAKLADLFPKTSVDGALSVYIFDHTSVFADPTTGLIHVLDDYEKPTGFWDFGITMQLSFVRYGDRDGGYIDQMFIINNDPSHCWSRKMWLEQVDSQGHPVMTEDRLIRIGLAYRMKIGSEYFTVSCIDYNTGELTRLPLWDMGVNPKTLEPAEVIDLTSMGPSVYKRKIYTGIHDWDMGTFQQTGEAMVWGKSTPAKDKIMLHIVRSNINYMLPESRGISDPNRIWFRPFRDLAGPAGGRSAQEWRGSFLDSAFYGLMDLAGVAPPIQIECKEVINDAARRHHNKWLTVIDFLAHMLDGEGLSQRPASFDTVKNIIEQTFVEQCFQAYLENRKGSNSLALKKLPHSEIAMVDPDGGENSKDRTTPIFFQIGMEPVFYDAEAHPADPLTRGYMPLFKVPIEHFRGQNGKSLLPESIKPDVIDGKGYVLCALDPAATELMGGIPVIFVPIFREGECVKVSHKSNPSDLMKRRLDTESAVPVISYTEKFWSSIEKYTVFTWDMKNNEYLPLLKQGEPTTSNGYIYSESEYTPMSFQEVSGTLKILENICSRTTTHGTGHRSETSIMTLSPKYFFDELCGLLVDKPKECLKLFKSFGGDKVLAELRKIKSLEPNTNKANLGWFARKNDLDDVFKVHPQCREDIESYRGLKIGDVVPTSVDLHILLLSYTGAQHAAFRLEEFLPIKVEEISPNLFKYRIGSASFGTSESELQLLDKVGVPVNEKGKTWKKKGPAPWYNPIDKKFSELKPEEIPLVRGLKTLATLEPVDIREVFGGRGVPGVAALNPQIPRKKQNPETFENLLRFTNIRLPLGGKSSGSYYTGYYSFVEWLMLEQMKFGEIFEIARREGAEKLNYMDFLVQVWGSEHLAEILQEQKSLFNEHHTHIDDFWTLYLHQRSRITPTEKSCLGVFGELFEVLEGDILGGIGNRHVLDFMAEKFIWSDDSEVQRVGVTMKLMLLRQLDPNLQTFVLRPEHLAAGKWELATYLSQYKIYEGSYGPYIRKIDIMGGTPKTVADIETPEQVKMQLIASILFKGGNIKELLTLGFSKQEVINTLDIFESQVVEGKIGEKTSRFQQLGVRHWLNKQRFRMQPSLKALKELVKSGAILGGVSTALGVGKMLPFLTIVAPILQAVGYAAVAAIEAQTPAPTINYNITSGEFYTALGGEVSTLLSNPDWNTVASIIMAAGVMITDLMEFGCGAFQTIEYRIDMDAVNIILSGAQAGMMDLGMCYCPESTLADIMKPLLGLVGVKLHPYVGLGFEVAGLVSMLPQADQLYHERIWPLAKLALGASLMGAEAIIVSSIANTVVINGINAVENAWENQVFGDPWYQDVEINFAPMLEWLPLDTWGVQDYIDSWITKYVYGMWWM